MKIVRAVLAVIGALLTIALIFYAYYGGFSKVTFQTTEQGGGILVYEKLTGEYKQTAGAVQRIHDFLLKDFKMEASRGFGIYYDNPQKVDKSKLRSDAGCILEQADSTTVELIKQKYNVKPFMKGTYITGEFPYKGSLSILVGVLKVYPAMNEYLSEHQFNNEGPIMEVYDMPGKKILYLKEMAKR